jgi:peptidoglycan/xylan/chitin deacetylase (PgdA/CDA1 family)
MSQSYLVSFIFHKLGPCRYPGDQYSLPPLWLRRLIALADEKDCELIGLKELPNEFIQGQKPRIGITFDDGYASDFDIALPILQERSLPATFFIVPSFIGRPGFLTWRQVKELADAGMSIGSHTLNHSWLSELATEDLRKELLTSRRLIEDVIWRPVELISLPGGYYNRKVLETSFESGYRLVGTSVPGVNHEFRPYSDGGMLLKRNGLDLGTNWANIHGLFDGRISLESRIWALPAQLLSRMLKPSYYEELAEFWNRRRSW